MGKPIIHRKGKKLILCIFGKPLLHRRSSRFSSYIADPLDSLATSPIPTVELFDGLTSSSRNIYYCDDNIQKIIRYIIITTCSKSIRPSAI
jgi:hypothetical protein